MKKLLLSSIIVATSFTMSAEKVAFIADGAQRFYTGDAKQVVMLTGFNGTENIPLTAEFGQILMTNTTCQIAGFEILRNGVFSITPIEGITINKVTIRQQYPAKNNGVIPGAIYTAATQAQTLENITTPTTGELPSALHASWIEVEYSGTPTTQVAPALFESIFPLVPADQPIKLTTTTEGASIEYNFEGEAGEWLPYPSAGITIKSEGKIYARAVKDGLKASPISVASFTPIKAGTSIAEFTFNDWATITPYADGTVAKESDLKTESPNKSIAVSAKTFASDGATINISKGTVDTKLFYSTTTGNSTELRYYSGAKHTITPPPGKVLINILYVGASVENMNLNATSSTTSTIDEGKGTTTFRDGNKFHALWTASELYTPSVKITSKNITGSAYKGNLAHIYVAYKDIPLEVSEMECENAPVEYFNLQGVRVETPSNGLYIRRQGSKVSKVLIQK